MNRVLLGALIAGIAVFVWGFVFWGVSPLPYSALSRTADDAQTGAVLLQHFPQTGTYYIPGRENSAEVLESLHASGPLAMVFFNREGKPLMSVAQMSLGLLHSIGFSLIVALALYLLNGAVPGYGDRVRLVFLVGLASALWMPLSNIIWWYYPAGWQLWEVLYNAVVWLIVALILAHFVRPRRVP